MLVSTFVHEAVAIEHCVVMAPYGHFFVHVDQHTTLPNHRHAPAAVNRYLPSHLRSTQVRHSAHLSVLWGQVL